MKYVGYPKMYIMRSLLIGFPPPFPPEMDSRGMRQESKQQPSGFAVCVMALIVRLKSVWPLLACPVPTRCRKDVRLLGILCVTRLVCRSPTLDTNCGSDMILAIANGTRVPPTRRNYIVTAAPSTPT